MATIMEIREMKGWLDQLTESTQRGAVVGVMEATNLGLAEAKRNARANFTGRHGYRKTGQLINAIFAGFDVTDGQAPEGVVGVRSLKGRSTDSGETKPYGRAQEYGATIKPVNAKWLWQPLWDSRPSFFRFMTPRQFMEQKRAYPDTFGIIPTSDGRSKLAVWLGTKKKTQLGDKQRTFGAAKERVMSVRESIVALFLLRKKSVIPARPYVGPAVAEAFRLLPGMVLKRILEQQRKQ